MDCQTARESIRNRKILLLTDMQAGHGGKSGRLKRVENTALEYNFILAVDNQR